MLEVKVILPIAQHNSASNQATIDSIQDWIAKTFGGYTAYPVSGAWYDEDTGKLYRDNSILVSTFVETDEQAKRILTIAREWAVLLQQIALTVTVSPIAVSFVEGTRVQAA